MNRDLEEAMLDFSSASESAGIFSELQKEENEERNISSEGKKSFIHKQYTEFIDKKSDDDIRPKFRLLFNSKDKSTELSEEEIAYKKLNKLLNKMAIMIFPRHQTTAQ